MSKISSERLIHAVKERRCIWDMRHVDYGDRQKRKTAWDEIACMFLCYNASPEERKQVGTSAQLKWKHLRDRYAKDAKLRNVPSAIGAKQKAPYLYKDQMSFLEEVIDTPANGTDDENAICKSSFRRRRKSDPAEAKRLAEQKKAEEIQDDDRHFLLSLVPWMKHIPPQFKFAARMEMLQLANRYAMVPSLSAITSSQSSPLPPTHLSLLYPVPGNTARSPEQLKFGSDEGSDVSLY